MVLRVGIHPNNLHLFLAGSWPGAFDGLDVTFVPYEEGRDSAKLLAEGRIDMCGTGSTPPILAQAAGMDVVYVAASAPRPANGGLVVAPGSPITDMRSLKGGRVALLDGSFHTYLLARELEKVGLRLGDVHRTELSPGASLRALGTGEVEAWVAMAPLLDQSLAAGRAQLLTRCGDTIPNRSVFWTLRGCAVSEATLDGFAACLARLGRDIAADPLRAARLLADAGAGEADIAAWREVVAARDWSIGPAGPQIIAEQQAEADTLVRHGDLPRQLDLATALRPAFLAA
ncbi:MAG TPA: ABC transporter substrate-binding protein [Stellaceae bacterium]|nr:ABC transporter substrate-binding protein [Stellaceae bacterium]